jgi:RNA polymerase sigma-70 factor (ECF subfamily)
LKNNDGDLKDSLAQQYPEIRRIVGKISKNVDDVDDIAQDCCLRIIEKEHLWSDQNKGFAAWMRAVTRNLTLRAVSKRRKERQRARYLSDENLPQEEKLEGVSVPQIQHMLTQFELLPEKQRKLLQMRFYEGKKVTEIAVVMGVSQQAVSKQVQRALEMLRKNYDGPSPLMSLPLIGFLFSGQTLSFKFTSQIGVKFLCCAVAAAGVMSAYSLSNLEPSRSAYSLSNLEQSRVEEEVDDSSPIIAQEPTHFSFNSQNLVKYIANENEQLLVPKTDTIPIKNLTNNRASVVKNEKVKDLEIEEWVNREFLIAKLTKELKEQLAQPAKVSAHKRAVLANIKLIIDNKFNGDVEKYVTSKFGKKFTIGDGDSIYVVCVMSPGDVENIKIFNRLQDDYPQVKVCGVLKPIVVRIEPDGWVPKNPNEVPPDPTFEKRNKESYLKFITDDEARQTKFLIGFNILKNYSYDPLTNYFDPIREIVKNPKVFVVDKKSRMVWVGAPEDLQFHMDKIVSGQMAWSSSLFQYKNIPKDLKRYQELEIAGEKSARNKFEEDYLNSFKEVPQALLQISEIILKRDLFNYRDTDLAFKCCLTAHRRTKGKFAIVELSVAEAYFELGQKVKAIEHLKACQYIIKKEVLDNGKINERIKKLELVLKKYNARELKLIKKAEFHFSTSYWPLYGDSQAAKDTLGTIVKDIVKGFSLEPGLAAEILLNLLNDRRRSYMNDDTLKYMTNSLIPVIKKSLQEGKEEKDHVKYAAMALFWHQRGNRPQAIEMMNKAIGEQPPHKQLSNYKSILKYKIEKKRK